MSAQEQHPNEETLGQLEAEIDNAQVTEDQGEALGEVRGYIQLLRDEPNGDHHEPFRERLEDIVTLFDSDHHRLVTIMQQTITVLSNAGV